MAAKEVQEPIQVVRPSGFDLKVKSDVLEGMKIKLKNFVLRLTGRGVVEKKSLTPKRSRLLGREFLNILIKLSLIFVLILGFMYASKKINSINQKEEQEIVVVEPTPTPTLPKTQKPSVYAQDAEILDIENEMKSIDVDMDNAKIEEEILDPPILDFKLDFNLK
jgi:hypothetical protein